MENTNKAQFGFSGVFRPGDVIPVVVPDFNISNTTRWMKYGNDNLFPQELVRLSSASPTHGELLNLLATGIAGKGWIGSQSALEFMAQIDEDNDEDLLQRMSAELAIFNGFSLQTIWGKGMKQITNVYPIPFQNVRAAQADETGWVQGYYVSVDWRYHNRYKPVLYSTFSKDGVMLEGATEGSQLLYVRRKDPASPVYPLPKYCSVLTDIATDEALSRFMFSIVDNCFLPAGMFVLPPDDDEENAAAVQRSILRAYSGPDRAGKPMFYRLRDVTEKVEYVKMGEGVNTSSIKEQVELVTNRIVSAHSVKSPTLAGLASGAGLSSTGEEIKTAYANYQNTVIEPYQRMIVKAMTRILKVNGIDTTGFGIEKFDPIDGLESNSTPTTN